jgi:hypothetical protein
MQHAPVVVQKERHTCHGDDKKQIVSNFSNHVECPAHFSVGRNNADAKALRKNHLLALKLVLNFQGQHIPIIASPQL